MMTSAEMLHLSTDLSYQQKYLKVAKNAQMNLKLTLLEFILNVVMAEELLQTFRVSQHNVRRGQISISVP